MKKCLNCGKEIEQAVGKRERLYCDSKCRAASFQKKSSGKRKYVRVETFEAMKKELEELRFRVAKNNEPENKKRILAEREGLESKIEYKKPLTPDECFDGKKLDKHYLGDEYGQMPAPPQMTIAEQIQALQDELTKAGPAATALIAFNNKKIKELKKRL